MGKLSELVGRDCDLEREIIRETGNIWPTAIGLAIALSIFWGIDLLRGKPWSTQDIFFAVVFIVGLPHLIRAWERHKVAAQMRHEREIKIDMKLNALLGLVDIKDDESDQ